jgi:hypothetical protein
MNISGFNGENYSSLGLTAWDGGAYSDTELVTLINMSKEFLIAAPQVNEPVSLLPISHSYPQHQAAFPAVPLDPFTTTFI